MRRAKGRGIEDEKKRNGVSEVKREKDGIREREGNASASCSLSVFSMSSPVCLEY